MADLTTRCLNGAGTTEEVWASSASLRDLPRVDPDTPRSGRVVVVAPHPDDEVLGVGGTTSLLAARCARVVLVAVTDGEASHPGRSAELRRVRPRESARAARELGLTPHLVRRLHLPDGGISADDVERFLVDFLQRGDLVLAPWVGDGHPDHDATGLAAARASDLVGADLMAYLVWAWHWASPSDLPWDRMRRVELGDGTAARKRRSVRCFTSQLAGSEPILSDVTLRRLTRDFEILIAP